MPASSANPVGPDAATRSAHAFRMNTTLTRTPGRLRRRAMRDRGGRSGTRGWNVSQAKWSHRPRSAPPSKDTPQGGMLTKDDIALFAVMSCDVNPAHLDQQYAEASMFHRIIGHGMWGGDLVSAVLGT